MHACTHSGGVDLHVQREVDGVELEFAAELVSAEKVEVLDDATCVCARTRVGM